MPEPDARSFAIATPHRLATQSGEAAFVAGGNAVDAALAAACALTVVYPHMCAVGGDVMALVHDGAAHAVNGSGRAPRAAPAGKYPVPRSVDAITVPGAVSAWQTIAERWGIRPLAAALKEAAELARGGVPIARSLAGALEDHQQVVTADAGLSNVFAPEGRLLGESDTLVQEPLAGTLERLASAGAEDFYLGGPAARSWPAWPSWAARSRWTISRCTAPTSSRPCTAPSSAATCSRWAPTRRASA